MLRPDAAVDHADDDVFAGRAGATHVLPQATGRIEPEKRRRGDGDERRRGVRLDRRHARRLRQLCRLLRCQHRAESVHRIPIVVELAAAADRAQHLVVRPVEIRGVAAHGRIVRIELLSAARRGASEARVAAAITDDGLRLEANEVGPDRRRAGRSRRRLLDLVLLLLVLLDLLPGIDAERCGDGCGDGGEGTDAPMLHGALLCGREGLRTRDSKRRSARVSTGMAAAAGRRRYTSRLNGDSVDRGAPAGAGAGGVHAAGCRSPRRREARRPGARAGTRGRRRRRKCPRLARIYRADVGIGGRTPGDGAVPARERRAGRQQGGRRHDRADPCVGKRRSRYRQAAAVARGESRRRAAGA